MACRPPHLLTPVDTSSTCDFHHFSATAATTSIRTTPLRMPKPSGKRKAKAPDEYNGPKRTKKTLVAPPSHIERPVRRSARVRKQIFRFMDLPQELKDMIYHELWQFSASMLIPQNTFEWIQVRYGEFREEDTLGLPNWLLVNHAILSEGLKQLFRQISWVWYRGYNRHREFTGTRQSPLIGLSVATNFSLTGIHVRSSWHHGRPVERYIEPQFHEVPRIANIVSSAGPMLKALTISLEFHMPPDLSGFYAPDLSWALGLDFLDASDLHLDALTVRLRVHADHHTIYDAHASRLREGVRDEIARVGEMLVGEEGKLSINTVAYEFSPRHNIWDLVKPMVIEYQYGKTKQ